MDKLQVIYLAPDKEFLLLVSLAQSDARPTCVLEVAGSIPAGSGNILLWRLIMKYILRSFSPFR